MSKKHRLREIAQKQVENSATDKEKILREWGVSRSEITHILGIRQTADEECPHVNLKYYYPKYQCFSEWEKDELKSFSDFCSKLAENNWQKIISSGGKLGKKTGFGCTQIKNISKLPTFAKKDELSQDLVWYELRVSDKARVHGFRLASTYFLVLLDKNHVALK